MESWDLVGADPPGVGVGLVAGDVDRDEQHDTGADHPRVAQHRPEPRERTRGDQQRQTTTQHGQQNEGAGGQGRTLAIVRDRWTSLALTCPG